MYHFIVRQKLMRAFRDLNAGRYERIIAQFAAVHRHVMFGRHALAGERRTLATTRAWYGRLKRLLPDLRFEIDSIAISGWPWDTRAAVTWRDTFTLPSGERGENQGVHAIRLAWGKIRELQVHCDTSKLEAYCARMVEQGLSEAALPPLAD